MLLDVIKMYQVNCLLFSTARRGLMWRTEKMAYGYVEQLRIYKKQSTAEKWRASSFGMDDGLRVTLKKKSVFHDVRDISTGVLISP